LNLLKKTTQILTALKFIRVNLELTVFTAILRSFSYFTVWTNLLVVMGVTIPLLWPQRQAGLFFSRPKLLSGFLVYIVVVGLAYHFLLADAWKPRGLHKIADILQHYVVPILFLLHWIFIPKGKLSWKAVPLWLVFPAVYLAFIMVRGTISNVYPYPFADVSRLGIRPVLINAGVFTLGFVVLGLATVGLDRLLGKTRLSQ
jgi:hypothetical protein